VKSKLEELTTSLEEIRKKAQEYVDQKKRKATLIIQMQVDRNTLKRDMTARRESQKEERAALLKRAKLNGLLNR